MVVIDSCRLLVVGNERICNYIELTLLAFSSVVLFLVIGPIYYFGIIFFPPILRNRSTMYFLRSCWKTSTTATESIPKRKFAVWLGSEWFIGPGSLCIHWWKSSYCLMLEGLIFFYYFLPVFKSVLHCIISSLNYDLIRGINRNNVATLFWSRRNSAKSAFFGFEDYTRRYSTNLHSTKLISSRF